MKRKMRLMLVVLTGGVFGTVLSVSAQSGADRMYAEGEGGVGGRSVAPLAIAAEKPNEGTAGETMLVPLAAGLSELYFFSGVSDDGEQGSVDRKEATSIHCTNLDPSDDAQVEVQVHQWNGTDMYTGTANIAPGRSFTFSTQNTTIYFEDVLLGGSPGTPAIFQGHGRINSDRGNVICSAQVLDPLNYPPQFITSLQMFRNPKAPKPEGLPMGSGGMTIRYFFSGVSDDGQQGSVDRKEATSIHCTNLDPSDDAQVEVQVHQWNGTDMYTGSANIPPGRSFTFSTQNTTIYFEDVLLGGSPGTPAIFQGHGRVLSAGENVVCTGQVLDPLNSPPLFISQLPLYDEYGYPAGGSRQRTVFYPIVSTR